MTPKRLSVKMASTVKTVWPETRLAGYLYLHTSNIALFRNTDATDMDP